MITTAEKTKADTMARALRHYVDLLLVCMTLAQVEREKCDKIQRRLLGSGRYGGDGNPKTTYLLPDEASNRYHADLDAAYREAGYADLKPGYCPALIAEHDQTKAEWALIEASAEFMTGVTNNGLLCLGLEKRQQYLDLLIGLVVNHPNYKPPTSRR